GESWELSAHELSRFRETVDVGQRDSRGDGVVGATEFHNALRDDMAIASVLEFNFYVLHRVGAFDTVGDDAHRWNLSIGAQSDRLDIQLHGGANEIPDLLAFLDSRGNRLDDRGRPAFG